jgi:hypothetical protein
LVEELEQARDDIRQRRTFSVDAPGRNRPSAPIRVKREPDGGRSMSRPDLFVRFVS